MVNDKIGFKHYIESCYTLGMIYCFHKVMTRSDVFPQTKKHATAIFR